MNNFVRNLNDILILMSNIATLVMLIPVIVAIINRQYLNKQLVILFWFCILRLLTSLSIQLVVELMIRYRSFFVPILKKFEITNMSFMAIITHLANFALLGWYFSLIIENKNIKRIIKMISIFLFMFAIINYLFIEGYKQPNVFNSTTSNVFCFILPLIHLWFVFREDSKVPIVKNPYFWISLGLVIPNLTGLITSMIGKKLAETDLALFLQVDIGYAVLQIMGYLLIAVGFYYARYTKYLPQKTTTSLPPQ